MIESVAVNYPINGGFSTFLRAKAQLSNAMGTICSHKDSFSSPSLKNMLILRINHPSVGSHRRNQPSEFSYNPHLI